MTIMSIESSEVAEDLENDNNQVRTHDIIVKEYEEKISLFHESYECSPLKNDHKAISPDVQEILPGDVH